MTDRITIFVYLFTSALNTMSIARLFRHKAAVKPLFLKEVAAYIAFYLITTIAFMVFGIPMVNLVLNLIGFFLLAGLYEYPNTSGHLSPEEVVAYVKENGYDVIHTAMVPDEKEDDM